MSFCGRLKSDGNIGRTAKRMLREKVGGFKKNVKLAVDQSCKRSKSGYKGEEGIAHSIVQRGFRVAAGEEMVTIGITDFGTVTARRKQVEQEYRKP